MGFTEEEEDVMVREPKWLEVKVRRSAFESNERDATSGVFLHFFPRSSKVGRAQIRGRVPISLRVPKKNRTC